MEIALPARLRRDPRRQTLRARLPLLGGGRTRGALILLLAALLIGGALLWAVLGRGGRPHPPAPPPRPVAALSAGGSSTAVSVTGTVLGTARVSASLPRIRVTREPARGARLSNGRLRAYLSVLGAAPAPLLRVVAGIYRGPHGITVRMLNGLLAYFGDASRPHAKWDSFAAVMASPAAAGATYVDLRLPERPGVGMPPGSQSSAEGSEQAQAGSAAGSTAAALAESLAKPLHGEPSIATPGTEGSEPPPPAVESESEAPEVTTPESAVRPGG